MVSGQPMASPAVTDGTTLEFHNFQATHGKSKIRGNGRKDPAPGGAILSLTIDADSLPLDRDLQQALAAIRMSQSWKTFSPSGTVNLAARVKLFTRYGEGVQVNPAEDLEMGLAFAGGIINRRFSPTSSTI